MLPLLLLKIIILKNVLKKRFKTRKKQVKND